MPLTAYLPHDLERYPRHERTTQFSATLEPGNYVYVQDCAGIVWVAPDGPVMHPRVLGRARPVVAAGELTMGADGEVFIINNLSGHFRCTRDTVLIAVGGIIAQGGKVSSDAIVRFEA